MELAIGGYELTFNLRRSRPRAQKSRLDMARAYRANQGRRARERREFHVRRRNLSNPLFNGGGWI